MTLADGYEAQIRPRSGMVIKLGITVINSPVTIYSDYRREIKECLLNLSNEDFTRTNGLLIELILIAYYNLKLR